MSLCLMVLHGIANVAIFCPPPVLPGYHSLMRYRRLLSKNFSLDSDTGKGNIQETDITQIRLLKLSKLLELQVYGERTKSS